MRPCCHRLSFVFWPDLFWNFSYKLCSFIKINWNVYYLFLSHRKCYPTMCRGRRLTLCFGSEYVPAFYESLSDTAHTLWNCNGAVVADSNTPVCRYPNSSLSVVSYRHYNGECLFLKASWNLYFVFCFNIGRYNCIMIRETETLAIPAPRYISHRVSPEEGQYCGRS